MKITLTQADKAPWVMRNKKIAVYRFNSDMPIKSKQNEIIQKSISQALGNDNVGKYKYSVCAVLNKSKREYTNTQFSKFNEIDIVDAIENFYNEYSMKPYSNSFSEFYVYIVQNFDANAGGDTKDDKNDCLFDCILKAYNYNKEILPTKLNQPKKLKIFLELQRNDAIPIEKLKELENILNCSFEVSGDASYISKDRNPKHINMTLCNGHYNFIANTSLITNRVKFNNVLPENIYTFTNQEGNYLICDGKEIITYNHSDFEKLRDCKNLLVFVKNSDLYDERKKYLKKANYFYEKYGEMINFYKSPYTSMLNYKNLLLRLQGTSKPAEISNHESFVIDRAFRGGVRFFKKGSYKNVYDYDINSMYAYYLTCGNFTFPIFSPEYQTITTEDITNWTCYQYGYYFCKPKGSHILLNYKDKYDWYSHYDLQIFKLLNIDIEICEKDNNHLFYSSKTRINGNLLKKYVDDLYKMRSEVDEEYKDDVKLFLSSIYGCMCEKNKKVKYASKENIIDIGNDFINSIEPTEKGNILETTDSSKIFKTDYARVSFITSYCRFKIIQIILKNVNLENLIAVNTDGFTTTTEISEISISKDIGKFKLKKYSSFVINHLSDIQKIE